MTVSQGGAKSPKNKARDKELKKFYESASAGATTPIELFYNMNDEQLERFNEDGIPINELFNIVKSDKPNAEWKAPNKGSYKDFAVKVELNGTVKIEEVEPKGAGWYADANDKGVVHIRKGGLGENWKSILAHEMGHQLSNLSDKLQQTVILNPANVLGRYNVKKNFFDGIYGEYNPDEAWATAVSVYINNRQDLKKKYPQAYKAVDAFFKASPSAKTFIQRVLDEYEKRYAKGAK